MTSPGIENTPAPLTPQPLPLRVVISYTCRWGGESDAGGKRLLISPAASGRLEVTLPQTKQKVVYFLLLPGKPHFSLGRKGE